MSEEEPKQDTLLWVARELISYGDYDQVKLYPDLVTGLIGKLRDVVHRIDTVISELDKLPSVVALCELLDVTVGSDLIEITPVPEDVSE